MDEPRLGGDFDGFAGYSGVAPPFVGCLRADTGGPAGEIERPPPEPAVLVLTTRPEAKRTRDSGGS